MRPAFFLRLPAALALAAILSLGAAAAALAAAASATPWTASTHSKVRLVSGTVDAGGGSARVAGVELRMDPGWKTYWRNPGDSGGPPSFDWSGSKNLKHVEVLYPKPHRFADAGGTAIGYDGDVIFLLRLTPEREGEPVELKLAFAYGLCKDLCIPNEVSLNLALPADLGKGDAFLLDGAVTLVPKPAGTGLLPAISNIEAKLDGDEPKLVVDAVFPKDASGTDLFIDGGDVLVPVPAPLGAPIDGKQRFVVAFASPAEAAALKGKNLRLTLVSSQGATEAMWKAN
jgi:DsbC/DsbD-like thiol-disulfide interchange protein